MREIKFRGKRIDNGEWVHGWYVKGDRAYIIPPDLFYSAVVTYPKPLDNHMCTFCNEVDSATVGQFTGLHDKNGVDIYEGDIMRTEGDMKEAIPIVKVTWQKGHFAAGGILGAGDYDGSDVVVIGNIHENPELIEKGTK